MLHGRAEELVLIDRLLADAGAGRSGALVLTGPAGIGKTALLDYAAARAGGLRVIRVAGIELEAELPFAGLHLLLRPVLDRIGALPEPQAAALRGAFGLAAAETGDRFLIGLAVLSMLAELAEDGPVLCLVDDAQWLDRSSSEALTFAARRLHHEGVLLLFAVRGAAAPVAGLSAHELSGLDRAAAAALLDEQYPELAPRVRARMLAETEGNPLALVELPSALSAEQRTGAAPTVPYDLAMLPLSIRVQRAFGARAARLDEAAGALLLIAAAEQTGEISTVLDSAAAFGAGPEDLVAAERSGLLVRQGDQVSFRHPLARAAILRDAPLDLRLAVHRALAETLCRSGNPEAVDRAVWHRAAASTGPDDTIADDLEAAAARAYGRADHAAASVAMERAAELTVTAGTGTRRLICAAKAAVVAGDLHRTDALVRRAGRRTVSETDTPRLASLRALVEAEFGSRHTAARLLIDAADRAPDETAGPMLVDAVRNGFLVGDAELTARAATMLHYRHGPNRVTEGLLGLARMLGGDDEFALPRLRACAEYAHAHSAELTQDERMNGAAMGLMTGFDREARDLLETLVAEAREQSTLGTLPLRLHYLASAEYATGHSRDAIVHAEEALALAQSIGLNHQMDGLRCVLAWGAALSGDETRCRELAEPALSAALDRREAATAALATTTLAMLDLGAGRYDLVFDRLESAAGEPMFVAASFTVAVSYTPLRVEAAVRIGQPGHLAEPLDRFRRWAAASGSPCTQAVYERCLAFAGPAAETEEHYGAAERLHEEGGRPFERARTALLYGEWLRRDQRKAEARTRLRAAAETFDRLGAHLWADRARAELRATGDTGRQPAGASVLDLLTPQELQVVRLAARGLSNREIGGQLFLSPRTVGYHLYKAYPKLGVAVRAELPALVDQL
ncbi:DNA-binding CsgD family transcriptional regulator [Nocardia sp. GAS34]|uniref:helix-turn-helix transcriptional regulator n=1 Tax=unclassified Nocardia TaxID=2637762 RepID=UPI003D24D285